MVSCLRLGTAVTDREADQFPIIAEQNGFTEPLPAIFDSATEQLMRSMARGFDKIFGSNQ